MTPQPQRTNSLAMTNGSYSNNSASRDSINSTSSNNMVSLSSNSISTSMPSSPVTRYMLYILCLLYSTMKAHSVDVTQRAACARHSIA
jgi:hypothetical protein